MSLSLRTFLFLLCMGGLIGSAQAQILDDEDSGAPTQNNIILDDEDEEEVFNELFSDHDETERDITKVKTFDDVLDVSAKLLKQGDTEQSLPEEKEPVTPLEGNLQIGITNGSFRMYKDPLGKSACLFSVTLKSNLNKPLKLMGVNIIYPERNFAFVFRNVKAGESQERFIRTSGDICYNIKGVPDIAIHKCRIYTSDGSECAERIKWVDDITAPDTKERRFFFY